MTTLVSAASGNFTAAATWKVADAASLLNSLEAVTATTTAFVNSQSFIPGAITIDALGVLISSRIASPSGTFTWELYNTTTSSSIVTATLNVSDMAAGNSWYVWPFAPITLTAGHSYVVRVKSSVTATVTVHRNALSGNWSRLLRTTTIAAPGAGDNFIMAGEHTGVGTGNDFALAMDNTSGTSFGAYSTYTPSISISKRASLTYLKTGGLALRFKHKGLFKIFDGGVYDRGSVAVPIPATSTATHEFDVTTNVDSGIECDSGGAYWSEGTLIGNVHRSLLGADVSGGSSTIQTAVATGWKAGDVVVVGGTNRTLTEGEERTLASDAVGTSVTFTAPLTYSHSGTAGRQAEVILLPRNVKVFGVSQALCGYIYLKAGHVGNERFTDHYYLGTTVGTKRGVYVENTVVASNHHGNSYHHFYNGAAGAIGVYLPSANTNATVTECDFWKCGYISIYAGGVSSVPGTSFDDNWMIGESAASSSYGMLIQMANANVRRNRANGWNASINLTGAVGIKLGTVEDNVTHSCGGGLVASGICDTYIDNTESWRNTAQGSTLTLCTNTWFRTIDSVGNGSGSISISMNNGGGVLYITGHGEAGFTQPYGVYIAGQNVDTIITGTIGGAAAPEACTNGDLVHTAVTTDIIFHDLILLSPTEHYPSSWGFGNSHRFQNLDGIAGNNKWVMPEGTMSRDTTIFESGASSLRMAPARADFKLHGPAAEVAVFSGGAAAISARVRKSVAGDGTAYNGSQPRLVVKANPAAGILADTVIATASGAAGAWETLSGTAPAVAQSTRLMVIVDCDGTQGWINVDNIVAANDSTSELEVYTDGVPFVTGGADMSLFSDLPESWVESGRQWKFGSSTNNRTGALIVAAESDTKHGVVYGPDGTLIGTYRGADLNTDPGEANVRYLTTYLSDGVQMEGRVVIPPANTVLLNEPSDTDGATLGMLEAADNAAIASTVIAALNTAMLPVNLKQINDAVVVGDGTPGNPWRGDF